MSKVIHGKNDAMTLISKLGKFGEILLKEYTGYDINGHSISLKDINYKSTTKLVWKCTCGNTWNATLKYRVSTAQLCKECKKAKMADDIDREYVKNTLKIFENNGKNTVKIINTTHKSDENKQHSKGICIASVDTSSNLLHAINSGIIETAIGNRIKSEYTGIDVINNKQYNMGELAINSKLLLQWKCNRGHKFVASVKSRLYNHIMCPICCDNTIYKASQLDITKEWTRWSMEQHSSNEIREQILLRPELVCYIYLVDYTQIKAEFMQEFITLSTECITAANYSRDKLESITNIMDCNLGIRDINTLSKKEIGDFNKLILPRVNFDSLFSSQHNIPDSIKDKYYGLISTTTKQRLENQ